MFKLKTKVGFESQPEALFKKLFVELSLKFVLQVIKKNRVFVKLTATSGKVLYSGFSNQQTHNNNGFIYRYLFYFWNTCPIPPWMSFTFLKNNHGAITFVRENYLGCIL